MTGWMSESRSPCSVRLRPRLIWTGHLQLLAATPVGARSLCSRSRARGRGPACLWTLRRTLLPHSRLWGMCGFCILPGNTVFTSSCGEERPPASLLLASPTELSETGGKKKTHGRPGKLPIREHAVPSDGTRKTWHQLRCLKLTFVQTKQYYTILVPKIGVQYCILCL